MKEIKNVEKVTNEYNEWKPSDLAYIKKLEWLPHELTITFYCQIRATMATWPDIRKDFFELSLKFENVHNFKVEFSSGLQQVSGFDIVDISNNYLEKINFQIEDYENDVIRFSCESIEVLEIGKPLQIHIY